VAESRDHFGTTDPSINPEPPEGSVDEIYAGGHEVERDGAGADDDEMAYVMRVAEVLRQHWEKRLAEAADEIEEGFVHNNATSTRRPAS
jgi:hypothetical protein